MLSVLSAPSSHNASNTGRVEQDMHPWCHACGAMSPCTSLDPDRCQSLFELQVGKIVGKMASLCFFVLSANWSGKESFKTGGVHTCKPKECVSVSFMDVVTGM